jgi:hypothetical protein
MRRAATIIVLAAMLPGCDLAVGAGVAILSARSDDDDGGAGGPAADPNYSVWVANLPTPGDATAQQAALLSSGGVPGAPWQFVAAAAATTLFDPAASAVSINAVLVTGSNTVTYGADAIEIFDASGVVIATATAAEIYDGGVALPAELAGAPDGVTAAFTASNSRAFAIARFTVPIETLRVTINAGTLVSGDVEWVRTWTGVNGGDAEAGGADANAAGDLPITASDWNAAHTTREAKLLRYSAAGTLAPVVSLEAGITATTGSHDLAVHTDGTVAVAWTIVNDIHARKYNAALAATVWDQLLSTLGGNPRRVEAHGVAVDGVSGNVFVAGAGNDLVGGDNHRTWKLLSGTGMGDPPAWPLSPSPTDTAATWWHGVAVHAGTGDVFTTGNRTDGLLGAIEDYTQRSDATGTVVWVAQQVGGVPDIGLAVAIDSFTSPDPLAPAPPKVVIGGNHSAAGEGLNGMIIKFRSTGQPSVFGLTHNGTADGDDAVLDVAVDAVDGSIYAVGYEHVSATPAQGENFWVRKYDNNGNVTWTRTFHGTGEDRAVSVVISGSALYVVGEEQSGSFSILHVRKYAK